MEILVLNARELKQTLPMEAAIQAMKDAYAQYSSGQATVPLRERLEVDDQEGVTLIMPAYLHRSGDMGIKIVSVFPNNAPLNLPTIHALVIAIDSDTGMPLAIIEGAALTAIRTGAGSGAATDLLSREDSQSVAVIGSGVQARTQLKAVCTIRDIRKVSLYSLDLEGAELFIEEMRGVGPIPAEIALAGSAADAVSEVDIICTATTSSTPVFPYEALRPGTHINAIGSFTPEMQEIDSDTIQHASVYVDARKAALAESGDLIIPIQQGLFSPENIVGEIGEVVTGDAPARKDEDQITLFKSVGIAVQDAVAAARALEGARTANVGSIIKL